MKTYTVNEAGLKQIHNHLVARHKLGGDDHFNRDHLLAWAEDVERNMNDAGQPAFEIRAHDSVSGHTELCSITEDGFDATDAELDDE